MINQHFMDRLIRALRSCGMVVLLLSVVTVQAQPLASGERLSTEMDPDGIIARAGLLTATTGEYLDAVRNYFSDYEVAAAYDDEYETETARSLAQSVIDTKVRRQVLHELGYDQKPTYLAEYKHLRWRHLSELAVKSLPPLTEANLTDEDLRKAYDNYTKESEGKGISFRFIFFRTLGLDEAAAEVKMDLAEKTLERVNGGEPFFDVMNEVSEVAEPRDTPYWVDESTQGFDPRIYKMLSSMKPSEISPIIKAKTGLFILRRFPKVERNDVKPYDEMMSDATGHRTIVREALRAKEMGKRAWLIDEIKDRYQAGAIETTGIDTMGKLSDSTPILKVGDQTLLLRDLKVILRKPLDRCTIDEINENVGQLSKMMLLVQYAVDKGLTPQMVASADYIRDLNRLQDDSLMFTSRAEVPDMSEEEMREFYDKHRSEFREICRTDARQIHVTPLKKDDAQKEVLALVVRDEAQRLKNLIENGESFEDLVKNYHSDRFELELKRWDDEVPSRVVFGDGKYASNMLDTFGQVQGPERVRDGFVVYSLVKKLPGKILSFDQAKNQINMLNKKQKAQELLNEAFQKHLKDLTLTEDLLYIPTDLKPKKRK